MTTPTITWTIEQMWVKPTDGSLTDVVITAAWRCTGTQDAYVGTIYNTASFAQPEGDFTPYDQLTQDQVLGWVWASGVDQFTTEAAVVQQIDNQINPPIITPPLPWAGA